MGGLVEAFQRGESWIKGGVESDLRYVPFVSGVKEMMQVLRDEKREKREEKRREKRPAKRRGKRREKRKN